MAKKQKLHVVMVDKGAKGEAITLYTRAPSRALALAVLEWLKESAVKRYPDNTIEGFADIDPGWKVDDWLSWYTAKDRKRLLEIAGNIQQREKRP